MWGVVSPQWTERAYISVRNVGINHTDLRMSVLVQEIIPADYAFVIHTVNPSTDDADEIYAEVVLGLGEVLVGNFPGRALSFVCRKDAMDAPKVRERTLNPVCVLEGPWALKRGRLAGFSK